VFFTVLSISDVLNRPLPRLRYTSHAPSASTTISPFSRVPTQVLSWDGFVAQAASRQYPTNQTLSPDQFRFSDDLTISDEESTGIALTFNVYALLNRLRPTDQIGMQSEATVIGKPDRVCYRSPNDVRMLIEIKVKWALFSNDLVTKYNEDMSLIGMERSPVNPTWRQVHQIFGYLCHNSLRYGILTTYDQTWFMRRDDERLSISPAIHYADGHPTLLQCHMYFMDLTHQDYTTSSVPPSPPQGPHPGSPPGDGGGGGSNDGAYQQSTRNARAQNRAQNRDTSLFARGKAKLKNTFRQMPDGSTVAVGMLNLHEFKIEEVLGEGRTGRVFRATWQGEPVALKVCDLYKDPNYEDDMLTEVATYKTLDDLQGVCVPRFKIAGYDGGMFAIAIEIAGSPMEVD